MYDLDYKILKSVRDIPDNLPEHVAWDLETTSTESYSHDNRIVGVGLSWKKGQAVYIPFNSIIDTPAYREELQLLCDKVLANKQIKKRTHGGKFDIRCMRAHDIHPDGPEFDSMIASATIINDRLKISADKESGGHSLDDVCLHHLNHVKIRTKEVLPAKKKGSKGRPTMLDVPIELAGMYCCEDADYTLRACSHFEMLLERPSLAYAKRIFNTLEMPVYRVIIDMECDGVQIDTKALKALENELITRKKEIISHLSDICGEQIAETLDRNQLEKIIYDDLKVHESFEIVPKKTAKSGQRAVSEEALTKMREHPFIMGLLEARALNKLISTYCEPIPKMISKVDGKLHASFNQHVACTGRLSSSEPNLQNIPIRTVIGKLIRGMFVSRWASTGGVILSADWSQCELRILAHIAPEPLMIEMFQLGKDAHIATAAILYEIEEAAVTELQRSPAKTVNFGTIYGMGIEKLAKDTGMTLSEAKAFIDTYMERFSGIRGYRYRIERELNTKGYTETLMGRRRYLPRVNSKKFGERASAIRQAGNFPIQGSNADMSKLAMIQCAHRIKKESLKSKMILQVHDELVFDVYPGEQEVMVKLVTEIMTNIVKLDVPLICDAKCGLTWAEAH